MTQIYVGEFCDVLVTSLSAERIVGAFGIRAKIETVRRSKQDVVTVYLRDGSCFDLTVTKREFKPQPQRKRAR